MFVHHACTYTHAFVGDPCRAAIPSHPTPRRHPPATHARQTPLQHTPSASARRGAPSLTQSTRLRRGRGALHVERAPRADDIADVGWGRGLAFHFHPQRLILQSVLMTTSR
jgi:hypothetical protein